MKIVRLLILIALGLNALAQVLYIFWDLFLLILATVFGAIFPDADTRVDSETAKHLAFLALSIAGMVPLMSRAEKGGRPQQMFLLAIVGQHRVPEPYCQTTALD